MPSLNLQALDSLATRLIDRQPGAVVLPIVGAGASLSAGIPTFGVLKQQIYRDFVRDVPELANVLKEEEVDANILDLPPFEFMSVLSRLAYGRKVIHEAIRRMTRHATHRPLAYELLAHLAKHRFVDHFISVNFDELLDEALQDEIPDRLSRIASTDDVPGPDAKRGRNTCYLFKPFGTMARDGFRLEPKDIQEYGTHSMWVFILETLFNRTIRVQDAVLVLIGYAAREPAFTRLIGELTKRVESLAVYTINPAAHAGDDLQECGIDPKALFHVRMEADTALELLLHILEMKHGDKHPKASWVPVARHRIISHLPHDHVADPMKRFTIEVILQALKSRGFFTIEAVAEISRIRRYSQGAFNALSHMRASRILQVLGLRFRGARASHLVSRPAAKLCAEPNGGHRLHPGGVRGAPAAASADQVDGDEKRCLVPRGQARRIGPRIHRGAVHLHLPRAGHRGGRRCQPVDSVDVQRSIAAPRVRRRPHRDDDAHSHRGPRRSRRGADPSWRVDDGRMALPRDGLGLERVRAAAHRSPPQG